MWDPQRCPSISKEVSLGESLQHWPDLGQEGKGWAVQGEMCLGIPTMHFSCTYTSQAPAPCQDPHPEPGTTPVVKGSGLGTSPGVQGQRLRTPNTGGLGSIPGQGTRSHRLQLKIPHATIKILCAATKTQHSEINK